MNIKRLLSWAVVFTLLLLYVTFFEEKAPEEKVIEPEEKIARLFSTDQGEISKIEVALGIHRGSSGTVN